MVIYTTLTCSRYRHLHRNTRLLLPVIRKFHKELNTTTSATKQLISDNTEISRDHMTPEISLHLITRNCRLWHEKGDNSPFNDPFWAFYWPGGQVLTRFILDNPEMFKGETVLDVGCGCGASSIAAKMVGASRVVANDTDIEAITAVNMNAAANGVSIETNCNNLIGQISSDWSTILLGDMFYDEAFRDSLVSWLTKQYAKYRTNIFIGDPGRLPLTNHPIRSRLTRIVQYDLPFICRQENNGLSTGYVWKLNKR